MQKELTTKYTKHTKARGINVFENSPSATLINFSALSCGSCISWFKKMSPAKRFENGARLCRRPTAARLATPNAYEMCCLLRLVENDTAALRGFQTGSKIIL